MICLSTVGFDLNVFILKIFFKDDLDWNLDFVNIFSVLGSNHNNLHHRAFLLAASCFGSNKVSVSNIMLCLMLRIMMSKCLKVQQIVLLFYFYFNSFLKGYNKVKRKSLINEARVYLSCLLLT